MVTGHHWRFHNTNSSEDYGGVKGCHWPFYNNSTSFNRLHRGDQRGEVSSTKDQLSMKKREPADSTTLTCSTCNRQFRARIGIVSHQTHEAYNDGISYFRGTNDHQYIQGL